MEFLTNDIFIYFSLAMVAAFLLGAAFSYSASQLGCKNEESLHNSLLFSTNELILTFSEMVVSLYQKHNMACSIHRQESSGEQDEEGPHLPVF